MLQKWIERLAEQTARKPWAVLGICLAVTVLALWALFQLPMYTSRKALFRADQPMVQRLDRFMENFGAASDLIVAIEGAPRADLERFALALADELSRQPGIRNADPRIDLTFFLDHAFTMVPPADLDAAESYVRQVLRMPDGPPPTIDEALDAASEWFEDPPSLTGKTQELSAAQAALDGVLFFLREWQRWLESPQPPQAIAWDGLLQNQPDTQALVAGNGFYATRDGSMLFVFVSPTSTSEDIDTIGPFVRTVRATTESLRERWRAEGQPVPTYGLTGNPAVVFEEFTSVQQGTIFTVASAAVLVLLLIVFVLKSLRRALVVFLPMGLGAIWGMALLYLTVGHLTMITMAFTAILFGLGVDYGIFVSSRILEELKNGEELLPAIARGTGAAARPVFTAGGATTLVFLALATVQFKGFSELGIVAACGVFTVQVATFVALPALFALLRPRNKPGLLSSQNGATAVNGGVKMPKVAAAIIVVCAIAVAALGTSAGLKLPVNYDVLALLPKDSEAAHYSRRMVAESDYQSEVVILTAPDVDTARRMAARAAELDTVARVQVVTDLFPEDAEARAAEARSVGLAMEESSLVRWLRDQTRIELPPNGAVRIAGILDKALDMLDDFQEAAFSAGHTQLVESLEKVRLSAKTIARTLRADPEGAGAANQRFLDELLSDAQTLARIMVSWKDARPLTPSDLPPSLKNRFLGKDGKIAVYLFPRKSVYDVEFLDRMLAQVYEIDPTATGFPTTHQVMSREAFNSFKNGSLLAIGVALLFLALVLRSLGGFVIAALPLLVGEGWMLGVLAAAQIPFNYGNMIALPLLMALALDYGVWFAHRRSELTDLGPWQVIRVAGVPILLAALTTLAGLGAITFASYRAISSLGLAVTIGLICCLACAMFISPAVAQLLDWRRK